MPREPGQHLLHYRLVEKIGQGGMGSVWRARDTTLDRDAAIKILPDALALDDQFLARFEREAKLLASLSHPNLAAVFGVHEADSTRFLAMELVPGEDLAARLGRGPLPIRDAMSVMGHIADALEAAHGRGVVHRDLKPANVRLMPDGRVKVLDFGLAKTVETEGSVESTGNLPLTATGVVLGTAPYMSPEQIRGGGVDARTDVWSFGCVLWECLTGARPFPGDTVPDQVTAILGDEPDWTALPPGTPPAAVRLLRRCLAKSRKERLHHIADARLELREAEAELRGEAAPAPPLASARSRWVVPLLGALVVAALAILVVLLQRGEEKAPPRAGVLDTARFTKLTAFPGDELDAAVSPDGKSVAFFADLDGEFAPYLGRTGGGAFVKVTEGRRMEGDLTVAPDRLFGTAVRTIGFMDDGEALWFSGKRDLKMRVMPLVGDSVRLWLDEWTIHVDWSPAEPRILYSLGGGGDPVFLAGLDGGNVVPLDLPTQDGYHQHHPTWSTDGKWIYLVRGWIMRGDMALWRVRPDGTGLEQLTTTLRDVAYPVPLDETTLLFIAREEDGSGPWLWEFDVETRRPRRAARGAEKYTSIAASRDRRTLVATVANPRADLWTVAIGEGTATESDAEPYPLPAVRAWGPRIRGDRVFYLAARGEGDGLWSRRDGEPYEVWKARAGARLEYPCAVSPDGARVAVVLQEGARARLQVMNADGTEPRSLMDHVDIGGAACWSPDGEWVAAGGRVEGKQGLYKVRVEDGYSEQVHRGDAWNPVWSPDDSRIVFAGPHMGGEQVLQAVSPDGTQLDMPLIRVPGRGERARFLPDRPTLVYITGVHPKYDFHLIDFTTGEMRRLTEFEDSSIMRTFDITPDGKTIVFDRRRDNSDVVLIERDRAE